MDNLITIILKFVLVPVLVVITLFVMKAIAKGNKALKMKKTIVFIIITSLILALPSLLGVLKYEFIWGGLLLCILLYLFFGFLFNQFVSSTTYEKIGFRKDDWFVLLLTLVLVIFSGWIYYLVFTWLSKMEFGLLAATTTIWFFIPVLYRISRFKYLEIPAKFYNLWVVSEEDKNEQYWQNVDTTNTMQINIKIKREAGDNRFASINAKLPPDISIGMWFDKFVKDQNIKFPDKPLETKYADGDYSWIFYTSKWLPFPLFTRFLNYDQSAPENKIKNKTTIYIRRVVEIKENENEQNQEK